MWRTPTRADGPPGPATKDATPARSVRPVPRIDPRRETALGALLILGTCLVGLLVVHGTGPSWIDRMVPSALTSGHRSLLTEVTSLRYPAVVVGGSVVLAAAALPRDPVRSLVCLVGPPSALASAELVLKPMIGRTLGTGLSYPSGSTVGAAALGAAAVLAVPAAWRRMAAVAAVVYAVWMALAVVSRQWHYPTDAVAGLAYGYGIMLLADGLLRTMADVLRRPPPRPHSPPG